MLFIGERVIVKKYDINTALNICMQLQNHRCCIKFTMALNAIPVQIILKQYIQFFFDIFYVVNSGDGTGVSAGTIESCMVWMFGGSRTVPARRRRDRV